MAVVPKVERLPSESKQTAAAEMYHALRAAFSHRHKLELASLKVVYFRLLQELTQYVKTGFVEYLQVVWKKKLYCLMELLSIDMPSWLPFAVVFRLDDVKLIFSDYVPVIPNLGKEDRLLILNIVVLLLQHWDEYIEAEKPQCDEDVVILLAYEQTLMKEQYRQDLTQLGMTSFARAVTKPFQITGQHDPEVFYMAMCELIYRRTGYKIQNMVKIMQYRQGSQSSLVTIIE
eukprot:gene1889-2066_t